MSKFLPDPQIQSLRAMRAGDIAFAVGSPAVMSLGKSSFAFPQPITLKSITVGPAVPTVGSPVATPSESPVVTRAFQTILSQDALQSKSLVAVASLETLTAMPSESPVVGVGFSTSVI